MAHFAELDNTNKVVRVIVLDNSSLTVNGAESESAGVSLCKRLFGDDTRWVQTSYNGGFRKNFAGIGFSYDFTRDAFIPPRPFASWELDESTCRWEPPTPRPQDDLFYVWDEGTVSWKVVDLPGAIP